MNLLYAPWRRSYAQETERKKDTPPSHCVFCTIIENPENDAPNFVLKRLSHNLILLNLYPYNGGHVLIIPFKHTSKISGLELQERSQLMESTSQTIDLLEKNLNPHGFNMGMNLGGSAAGGSVPEHIHMHILPRWHGDTSFLPSLADTKPISENLILLYNQLKKVF